MERIILLENRVVFLIGEITPGSAARVTMQMLYLEKQKPGQDIHFYINSPGGVVDDTEITAVSRSNLAIEGVPQLKGAEISVRLQFTSNRPF